MEEARVKGVWIDGSRQHLVRGAWLQYIEYDGIYTSWGGVTLIIPTAKVLVWK